MEQKIFQSPYTNRLCRTCMDSSNDFSSLFDYVIIGSEKVVLNFALLKCTSLEVMKTDEYSQSICKLCVKKLTEFYLFREECLRTHVKFKQLHQSIPNYKQNEINLNQIDASNGIESQNQNNFTDNDNVMIDEKKPLFHNDTDFCEVLDESSQSDCEDSQVAEKNIVTKSPCHDKNELSKFLCIKCNKVFRSKYSLNEHQKIHSSADKFKCKLCEKQFSRIGDVNRHMVTHTGLKPYSCTICNKSFSQSGSLSIHMKKHENINEPEKKIKAIDEHLCSICGKKFNKAFSLTVHLRRHLGEKPYKCNICEMSFVTSGRLTSHKRSHTGERPFKCKHCDKTFSHSTVMNTHLKTHLTLKPHQCSHCPKTFSALHELNIHNRGHTGEKPFKCTMCAKKFSSNKNMKEHLKIHTEEKLHLCITCGKSFRRRHHLKNHMNTHPK